MGATDYLGMIGAFTGPGAIAGSALSSALGGVLAGRRAAPPPRSMSQIMELMKQGYMGTAELDDLMGTPRRFVRAKNGSMVEIPSEIPTGNRFYNVRIENPARKPEPTVDELLASDAMDEWDREFERNTGALPPFSKLVPTPSRRDAY